MTKKYIPVELRRLVVERARNTCEYCRYPGRYAPQTPPVDHIIPEIAGGRTTAENLAQSCQGCNGHKATRTSAIDPVTGHIVSLFHPRQQQWREHFAWSEDYLQITGLTATGRETVEALQLNRDGLVNMRRVLYAIGEHPPVDSL
ncbi:MAG TPA: HNH endonuclease [Blastocatellia bacterium]|nr:HNH endonuclease [Blastocatellia bacterium]